MNRRPPLTPILLITPFFLWGTSMVLMKGTLAHTTPLFLAGLRLVPAGAIILLATWIMGRSQPRSWRAWGWIGLFSLVDGTLFQGCLTEGLRYTGAGLGSVLIDSQPLGVALLALWIFGEHIGAWGWLGLGLGGLGISLIGWPDHGWLEISGHLAPTGEALMLLAALCMALGTVMVRLVSRHVDPVVATGWHMVLGGIPLFVLSAGQETQQWENLTGTDWSCLGYAAILGSAVAYGLFFHFASQENLTSFSSLTFLTPIFALTGGSLALEEQLSGRQWLGVILTLGSVYLINQRHHLAPLINPGSALATVSVPVSKYSHDQSSYSP